MTFNYTNMIEIKANMHNFRIQSFSENLLTCQIHFVSKSDLKCFFALNIHVAECLLLSVDVQ